MSFWMTSILVAFLVVVLQWPNDMLAVYRTCTPWKQTAQWKLNLTESKRLPELTGPYGTTLYGTVPDRTAQMLTTPPLYHGRFQDRHKRQDHTIPLTQLCVRCRTDPPFNDRDKSHHVPQLLAKLFSLELTFPANLSFSDFLVAVAHHSSHSW